ncbi:MAG: hypothetical protein PVS3B1_09520 [Ktedonobacteraceae bacterium]
MAATREMAALKQKSIYEKSERREAVNVEMIIILMLLTFIVGLLVGITIGRPKFPPFY